MIYNLYYPLPRYSPSHTLSSSLASAIVLVLSTLHRLFPVPHHPRANAMPQKCFISFSGFGHPVFRCTFCMCYLHPFAIAIDFLVFLSPPHEGLVWSTNCIICTTPTFFYSLPYHWTVYTELASAVKQLVGVLFGFWRSRFPPNHLPVHYK